MYATRVNYSFVYFIYLSINFFYTLAYYFYFGFYTYVTYSHKYLIILFSIN